MIAHNLPIQPTPFIGRDEELAEISALLANPACRLLTLVGPGGIGKTRLAIQAAAQSLEVFPDGVYFVPLQPLSSTDYLIPALAEALQLSFQGQENPAEQLLSNLSNQRILLVMDNFEHLLDGAGLLASILEAAPRVKILITSREVLDLQEEWIRPVLGLKYPQDETVQQIENYSALQLFIERASRVQAGFSLERDRNCAIRICQLVQGMPLAIELAAAWLKTLPCSEVAGEIQRSLDFLSSTMRNVPERHRNMRAVFEQSWKLLNEEERRVFQELSVFQGGFMREAAQVVAGAGLLTLQALVDKSLLRITPSGRYEIHELLRQFAAERLDDQPQAREQVQDRYCAYFAGFLERQEAALKGPGQMAALAEIDAEIDNLRLAWRWAADRGKDQEIRQSMGCLLAYYQLRTRIQEGAEIFRHAVDQFKKMGRGIFRELGLYEAWFRATVGDYRTATLLYRQGFDLVESGHLHEATAMALAGMTFIQHYDQKPWQTSELQNLYQQGLAYYQQKGSRRGAGWMLYGLGSVAYQLQEYEQARQHLKAGLEHFRAQGDSWGSTFVLNQLGIVEIHIGDLDEARHCFYETLRICQEVGDPGGIAFALAQLGEIAAKQQQYESSFRYLGNAVKITYEMKKEPFLVWHLFGLGEALEASGYIERAVEIFAFIYRYASDEEDRRYVQEHLQKLQAELPQELFARASQRGETSAMEPFIEAVLAEFAGPGDGAGSAQLQALRPATPTSVQSLVEPLSPRELEVLGQVAAGLSNREIARKLVISVGAVKKHINNIFGKLHVHSRTQAVARARELGLLPP